ncbi:MAG TPA: hypothetical protein VN603_00885 [Candidatus Acidoferrales bacterium]|nr:hypothetical protein [Candidatus Acidoferrales bacterium]
MTHDRLLPGDFSDLEPFSAWGLATETARNHKRIDCEQAEIEAFAHAMLPRLDAVCDYLDAFSLDALPEDARRLYFMLVAVAEIAPCVEGYGSPRVPNGYDSRRFRAQEDFPLRPRV